MSIRRLVQASETCCQVALCEEVSAVVCGVSDDTALCPLPLFRDEPKGDSIT